MQPDRVKKGFHRLGVALSVPLIMVAGVLFAWALYEHLSHSIGHDGSGVFFGTMAAAASVLAYLTCRVLGWIIAAFLGD